MLSSGVLSCRTGEASLAKTSLAKTCPHQEANPAPRTRPLEVDSRTRMLLEHPIAPTILRLALPNVTVMTVQILIGLLEVYFVSRTGLDGLADVAPVFPLILSYHRRIDLRRRVDLSRGVR